jgi:hypothetical protein
VPAGAGGVTVGGGSGALSGVAEVLPGAEGGGVDAGDLPVPDGGVVCAVGTGAVGVAEGEDWEAEDWEAEDWDQTITGDSTRPANRVRRTVRVAVAAIFRAENICISHPLEKAAAERNSPCYLFDVSMRLLDRWRREICYLAKSASP